MADFFSSPALLQALSGGGGLLPDPQVAALQPRMQLASALTQQGTSDAPTNKMGAFSRLAQALLGGYMMNSNNQQLQDIQSQRQKDAVAAANYMTGGDGGNLGLSVPKLSTTTAPTTQPEVPASQPSAAPASGGTAQPSSGAGSTLPTATPAISAAVHQNESGGSMAPGITGDNGAAAGPMQVHQAALDDVNKATGNNYTLDQVKADPLLGKRVGDAYIHILEQRFPGRPDLVAAAYNAGPTRTQAAVDSGAGIAGLPQSTQAYVAKTGLKPVQVAGPGAPYETASTGQPQDQPGPQAPATPPQTGVNNPSVANALEMIHRAQAAMLANPYNPLIQKQAQMVIDNAHTLMGLDTFTTLPDGTQINNRTGQRSNAATPNAHFVTTPFGAEDTTGTHAPVYKPAPRLGEDVHGNTLSADSSGVSVFSQNPSGITGNTPEANAMRTIAEIGPKIANGTATDQERASYSTAATLFQNYKTQTNPADKNLISVPERPLPAGMPQPAGATGGATPVTTGNVRGAEVTQAVTQGQADADAKKISDEQAQIMQGHNSLGTTATIRATLPSVATGQGADMKLLSSQIGAALGISPDAMQKYIGTNPVQGELLQKKLFELSTGAVRGMGAREPGSVMTMFQKNYPNMSSRDMTIDAMTRLLDMDQTYKEDEIGARRNYLNNDLEDVKGGKSYKGFDGYTPPDPRIYQSAALASGGLPYATWSQGLSPQQQTEALRLAARVYPDATVLDSKGVKHTFQQPQAANAAR